MFDTSIPRVSLGGKSGPMDITSFVNLVDRNRRVDNINWHRRNWDGPLGHLCTITVGNPDNGWARNVPTPVVPEFSHILNNGQIRARGWRMLLSMFISDGWVYPSQELLKWLGAPMWDAARIGSPCR